MERVGHQAHGDREDPFVHLLMLSWARLTLVLFALFLAINLLFGLLYWMVPGSIGGSNGGYLEAVYFSVQTVATIGYGGMTPIGPWANLLVLIESFAGILFSAMATGVFFAKFARPRPRVLFSDTCVVHRRDGVDTLCFRVANLRGVEIVEAAVRVSVLKTYVTSEGERMRRFFDLQLERDRSPLFVVSWLVMHKIDANSPIFGMTQQDLLDDDVRMLVSLTGIDDTYAQTVYARHNYDSKDIHCGARFVDVIETLPGGGIRIDFHRFHEWEPVGGSTLPPPPEDPADVAEEDDGAQR